jgi:ribosome-binding protein aMBF1 (putative translation factor)
MKEPRPTFEEFKKIASKNKKFQEAYDDLQSEFDWTEIFLLARKNANFSQEELAEKLHTKQPAIARLENGGFKKTSLEKLELYADALGYSLHISLVPKTPDPHLP